MLGGRQWIADVVAPTNSKTFSGPLTVILVCYYLLYYLRASHVSDKVCQPACDRYTGQLAVAPTHPALVPAAWTRFVGP